MKEDQDPICLIVTAGLETTDHVTRDDTESPVLDDQSYNDIPPSPH